MPKKSSHTEPEDFDMEEEDGEAGYQEKAKKLRRSTEEIEAEKERKRLAREEKKFRQEQERKMKQLERWIAPILLGLTLLISYIVWKFQ